jgi:hypothetical protein
VNGRGHVNIHRRYGGHARVEQRRQAIQQGLDLGLFQDNGFNLKL